MKRYFLSGIILLPLFLLSACPTPKENEPDQKVEQPYNIPILWESDIKNPLYTTMIGDETSIYVYDTMGYPFDTANLNKVKPETGETIWSTGYFGASVFSRPMVIDNYIYSFVVNNVILCFDKETGIQLAHIKILRNGQEIWRTSDHYFYKGYFYFGMRDTIEERMDNNYNYYLVRVNISSVIKDGNSDIQYMEPELLWQSKYGRHILSTPIAYNDVVYFNTATLDETIPVEFAGINIITKEEVLYDTFGVDGHYILDQGSGRYSLYVKDGILYYLNHSITAYDLKNHKKLYHILFDVTTPFKDDYMLAGSLGAVFYKDRIYYTNQYSNVIVDLGFRNIFCVNEKNGKLEWGAIPKKSEALGGVPIIYDNKVFVPHMNGICVYDADTGKLLGVDENIEGSALCFNQLYGSTMITSRESDEYPNGQIIALDLRRQ